MRPDGLLSIGQFARRVGISVKSVRHYHAVGLLEPQYVDARTGYRYYGEHQADDLRHALAIQSLGMPLREVRDLIRAGSRQSDVHDALVRLRARAVHRVLTDAVRLSALEAMIRALQRPQTAMPPVSVEVVPDRPVLVARVRGSTTADADACLVELASPVEARASVLGATVWHECGRSGHGIDCTIAVPDTGGPSRRDTRRTRLPGGVMAVVRHDERAGSLANAYLAGWQWLAALEKQLAARCANGSCAMAPGNRSSSSSR